jgi:hypothetical protein
MQKTDIDHAVEMAVAGRFNNGQNIASKRFIMLAVADEFWKSLPIK